jgi:hypothetical protein
MLEATQVIPSILATGVVLYYNQNLIISLCHSSLIFNREFESIYCIINRKYVDERIISKYKYSLF